MKRIILLGIVILGLIIPLETASAKPYGASICNQRDNYCKKIIKGESWKSLFPNASERNVVMRLNRMNVRLRTGMIIAVPRNLKSTGLHHINPMPKRIEPTGVTTIVVNQKAMAWAAYNSRGKIVRWGPASGGKAYCPDVGRGCRTAIGEFTMYSKRGANCVSSIYPVGRGGAKMPYCMFFHRGYALHASPQVPGYHASHGCVRIFYEDAKWLHQNFIELGTTKVIVQRL